MRSTSHLLRHAPAKWRLPRYAGESARRLRDQPKSGRTRSPRREGLDLYGLCADHHKPGAAPAGAGLLNTALTERAAVRLWDAPDASLAQHALEQLSTTPLGRLAPAGFAVHRWQHVLPLFGPGYLPRLGRFLGRMDRSPRLAFAGDYLVGPWAEGAVASGLRAAAEIAEAL